MKEEKPRPNLEDNRPYDSSEYGWKKLLSLHQLLTFKRKHDKAILIATFIFVIAFISFILNKTRLRSTISEPIILQYPNHKAINNEIATIQCYEDLASITGYPHTIEIASLTSPLKDDLITKGHRGTVNKLNVTGSITEEWLHKLVTFFPKIQTILLNMDGLCKGSNEKDRNALQAITLHGVYDFGIEGSNLCSIISWIFKWELPRVKTIRLNRVVFTRKSFKEFLHFLNKTYDRLESVEVQNCQLCQDCDWSQIPLSHNDKLKVFRNVN